jgi:hypothetical protein
MPMSSFEARGTSRHPDIKHRYESSAPIQAINFTEATGESELSRADTSIAVAAIRARITSNAAKNTSLLIVLRDTGNAPVHWQLRAYTSRN